MRTPVLDPGSRCRVAIVGAGVSGVVSAKSLLEAGFEVSVFERAADVGGVWSASNSYPGIATQDDRRAYAFSGLPMSGVLEDRAPGDEVRAYLERYARRHRVDGRIRLRSTVVRAELIRGDVWEVESEGTGGTRVEHFDWLVVANGTCSSPHVPSWPGRSEFEAAGGVVVNPGRLGDGRCLDDRGVVVVGWGKSACDIAAVASARSTRVDVVARSITWKYPRRTGLLGLDYRHLILTRTGERLLHRSYRGPSGRVLVRRLPERLPRMLLGRVLANAVDRRTGLTALGLRPRLDFRASTSLVTDGFFEAVAEGRIVVHREATVQRLGADGDRPLVELADGARLHADVVVVATGYDRTVDFLAPDVRARLLHEDGAFLLHRRILAVDVPRLAFIGWTDHYRSPVTVEIAAAWLVSALLGLVDLPVEAELRRTATRVPLSRDSRLVGFGNTVPGLQMHELDQLLRDTGRSLPLRVRVRQLWRPIDPADYATVLGSAGRAPRTARRRAKGSASAVSGARTRV